MGQWWVLGLNVYSACKYNAFKHFYVFFYFVGNFRLIGIRVKWQFFDTTEKLTKDRRYDVWIAANLYKITLV